MSALVKTCGSAAMGYWISMPLKLLIVEREANGKSAWFEGLRSRLKRRLLPWLAENVVVEKGGAFLVIYLPLFTNTYDRSL